MFNFVFFLNFTYENDVEIEKPVDEVEMPGLYPVQVGAVGCEDVVLDDVEGGERRLAIVLKNGSMLTHQQHLFTTKSQLTFCLSRAGIFKIILLLSSPLFILSMG